MKEIDINTWKRKALYECFSAYDHPVFNIAVRTDVTNLVEFCKKRELSFFTAFLYVVSACLNGIEDFRLRIMPDGKVVLFDKIDPSFVVMNDCGVIVTCPTPMEDGFSRFYKTARDNIEKARKGDLPPSFNKTDRRDLFYISCMPWADFCAVGNPYNMKDASSTSIPRLTWGRYSSENGRLLMTLDISVHHALMDGLPVTQGFNAVQAALDDIENFLK